MIYFLERASVDRWRLLVNVIFIRLGICWIGKEIYKFFKCHKVYKLWVDLKFCKFKMLYKICKFKMLYKICKFKMLYKICKFKNALPGKSKCWQMKTLSQCDALLKNQGSKKSEDWEKRFKNAKRINRLIECALRAFYCATQLNVIETVVEIDEVLKLRCLVLTDLLWCTG